jgi:ribosomal protein S18 acetylase RimI-like enzyme
MTAATFRFEVLGGRHDRQSFACGEEALDRYFRHQATEDVRRRVTNCFVIVDVASGSVAGYYTLSASGISLKDLPPDDAKKVPRYPEVPVVRIGRLAVDRGFQGRGIGGLMLMNAVDRTMQDAAAAFALLVDAKNDGAVAFYERFGFRPLTAEPRTMYLPFATARKTLLDG